MKKVLIILSLFLYFTLGSYAQNTYYISTEGSDITGDGSLTNPWATWQKGTNMARPGDTVYIRGGVYYPQERLGKYETGIWTIDPDRGYGRSGTSANPIHYFAYPDDYESENFPILDISQTDLGSHNYTSGLSIRYVEFIHFKGLTIRSVPQNPGGDAPEAYGISSSSSLNLTFENMTVHNISGRGFYVQSGAYLSWYEDGGTERYPHWATSIDTTRFINCDVYNLCDTIDYTGSGHPGNSADGWKAIFYRGNVVFFEGCRVWNYTDDGIDPSLVNGAEVRINNCWAMPGTAYDGIRIPSEKTGNDTTYGVEQNGFKLAYALRPQDKHCGFISNSMVLFGRTGGGFTIIDATNYRGNHIYYNNTSIGNYWCFSGTGRSTAGYPREEIYRNNIAFEAYGTTAINSEYLIAIQAEEGYGYPESHNTWDYQDGYPSFAITDSVTVTWNDFLYDSTQMVEYFTAPRQADGSLPAINPVSLDPSSDLIDAGVDIGLPYNGKAPDIGAAEYGTVSVELITPRDSSEYLNSNTIPLKAVAIDTEGNIDRVLFYTKKKEIKIGDGRSTGNNQWEFDWQTDTIGFFDLRAVAVNQAGDSATSSQINVFIFPEDGPGEKEEQNCEVRYFDDKQRIRLLLQEPLPVETDLYIVSADGKIWKTITLKQTDFFKDINISDIVPGFYILQFENMEGTAVCNGSKFVKIIN